MRNMKQITALLTAGSLLSVGTFPGFLGKIISPENVLTAKAVDVVDSGNCGAEGDNVTWELTSDGTLTICGVGDMMYMGESSPWYPYRWKPELLTSIVVTDGVTSISDFAFVQCSYLKEISISESVTSIGYGAFNECSALTEIIIPESVTEIGPYAFYGCSGLMDMTIPMAVESVGACAFCGCDGLNLIRFKNPDCELGDLMLDKSVKIAGYQSSTAQAYAEENGNEFIEMDEEPDFEDSEYGSIYISQLPYKTIYGIGEELDLSGGKISGSGCDAGRQWDIFFMDFITVNTSEFDNTKPGTCTIYVYVSMNDKKYTASFEVTVVEKNPGDVNVDEVIDISDVIFLARVAAEDMTLDRSKFYSGNADVNQDEIINAEDTVYILKMIGKLV